VILYLLSFLDILTATVLVLHVNFGFFPLPVLLIHGIYLGMKGLVFSAGGDTGSKIDVLCSAYIILVAFGLLVSNWVALAIFIWLAAKAGLGFVRV